MKISTALEKIDERQLFVPAGRRSLRVYMRPDVIKALKKSVIDLDRTAYSRRFRTG